MRKTAFTLAEVLITLGIIGIVAALTMPSLIAKHQEKVTSTKLKKFYSVFSQAFELAVMQEGDPADWDLIGYDDAQGSLNLLSYFAPHLKIAKNCGLGTGCFPDVDYKTLDKLVSLNINRYPEQAKIQLNDGTLIRFVTRSADCSADYGSTKMLSSVCASIDADINGFAPPNQWGRDIFGFNITKYGVVPNGTKDENISEFFDFGTCKISSYGYGCTAWVIYNENMDYLHCDDLSWDGKTKCTP
ncbi:MAG: type II secretion system GspH family protein [Heliobacteriaceae bacterium]|nr:type II secretion system GspH family protein [Heliobacteriaceae bacterium]